MLLHASFNPHPAFRPGDARRRKIVSLRKQIVSIRTRPFGRVMLSARGRHCAAAHAVSIRTRPFGRVMQLQKPGGQRRTPVSIRTRPFGRVMLSQHLRLTASIWGFNPHPAFRPGDASRARRPWRSPGCFNPHPAFRPGDACRTAPWRCWRRCFNPHPAFRPGDAARSSCNSLRSSSFNPHPAFRPGDAAAEAHTFGLAQPVSIRTRPFGRVMHGVVFRIRHGAGVSIRTRPFGRVMRPRFAITWNA